MLPQDDREESLVLSADEGGVRRLTLNRPSARNALSLTLLEQLTRALIAAERDPSVRVVVIASAGAVFCAGHDLRELEAARAEGDRGRAVFKAAFKAGADLMARIAQHPRPIIAEVQGPAIAAGCLIVAQCDLALAARTAHFSAPGIDLGLFCSTPMVGLTRAIAPKAAFALLFTGEAITAERAAEIGLINRVTREAELRGEMDALAQTLAAKNPEVVALGKAALRSQERMRLKDAYDAMVETMTQNMMQPAAARGVGAFLKRRRPSLEPRS